MFVTYDYWLVELKLIVCLGYVSVAVLTNDQFNTQASGENTCDPALPWLDTLACPSVLRIDWFAKSHLAGSSFAATIALSALVQHAMLEKRTSITKGFSHPTRCWLKHGDARPNFPHSSDWANFARERKLGLDSFTLMEWRKTKSPRWISSFGGPWHVSQRASRL